MMARWMMFTLCCAGLVILSGCNRDNTGSISGGGLDQGHQERQAMLDKYVPDLAAAADLQDPDQESLFIEAVRNLIVQGSAIEPQLIEVLATSNDWGQRYGVIFVLDAVGTRSCIPILIESLNDDQPLVALKAVSLLRVLCDHRIVPISGEAAANLPPVPVATGLDGNDDQAVWERWHMQHGDALRQAWLSWWEEHRRNVTVQ